MAITSQQGVHAQSELHGTEKSPALPLLHLIGTYVDHFWPQAELSHLLYPQCALRHLV